MESTGIPRPPAPPAPPAPPPSPAASPPAPQEEPSFFVRMRDVLFAPERGFQAVARRPSRLWQPLVLLALVNGLLVTVFYDRLVVPEQMLAIEARGLGEAETRETERLILGPGVRAATIALSGLGSAAVSLVVALVTYLAAAYLLGGEGSFLGTWAAVAHALLVGVVEWLVKLPVMLARGRLEVLFGPALVLSEPDRGSFLDALLMKFDVFTGWKVILIGIGVAIVHNIRPRRRLVQLMIGLWILWAVISAAFSSALMG